MATTRLLIALPVALAGCAQFRPPAEGSERARAAEGPASDPCAKQALIEDGEDGDDQIAVRAGRSGYLYTFADDKGTSIEPKGDDVKPAGGGAGGSSFALRVKGKLAADGEPYAGIGFSFSEPKASYDATSWRGLSFVAKRSASS